MLAHAADGRDECACGEPLVVRVADSVVALAERPCGTDRVGRRAPGHPRLDAAAG
jgi:hypothetical protein